MPSEKRWIEPKFAVITAVVIAIIVYGSLYPFQFHPDYLRTGAFWAVTHRWHLYPGRADLISNILLYIPLGLFSVRSVRGMPGFARVALVTIAGATLSFGIEMAQYYDSGRDAGMEDVYTNTTGTLIGAIAGVVFRRHFHLPFIGKTEWRPFVVLLLACWLGYRLYPYVPAFSFHKLWIAVRPLTLHSGLSLTEVYRQAVVWIAIALLLEAVLGTLPSRFAVLILVPAMLFARALIVGLFLTPTEVWAAVIGAVVWVAVLSRLESRGVVAAVLFVGGVALQALSPFNFSSTARHFGWIPFLGFLEAPRETGIHVFFEKVFTYGGLLWLLVRAGCSLGMATLVSGVLVFCLRLSQVYLPGRSAEITDLIMLLILAGVFKAGDVVASKPAEAIPR